MQGGGNCPPPTYCVSFLSWHRSGASRGGSSLCSSSLNATSEFHFHFPGRSVNVVTGGKSYLLLRRPTEHAVSHSGEGQEPAAVFDNWNHIKVRWA